jgi:hypothetical protein
MEKIFHLFSNIVLFCSMKNLKINFISYLLQLEIQEKIYIFYVQKSLIIIYHQQIISFINQKLIFVITNQ